STNDVDRFSASCLEQASDVFAEALRTRMATARTGDNSFEAIRQDCEAYSGLTLEQYSDIAEADRKCAFPMGAAGVAARIQRGSTPSGFPSLVPVFHAAYAQAIGPALLVALDDVVQGVEASFSENLAAQVDYLEDARQHLRAPARYALQAPLLNYIQKTTLTSAAGDDESPDPAKRPYAGLIRLTRLFQTSSHVEAELAAWSAASRSASLEELLNDAQYRAVMTLFQAATI